MSKHRIRSGYAPVASQSEIESSTHAVAGDCRTNRRREVLDRLHEQLAPPREFVGRCCIE